MQLADRLPLIAFAALALGWSTFPHPAARCVDLLAPERSLASLVPPTAKLYVESAAAGALLAEGLEHPLARTVLDSELGRTLVERAGTSPREALAKLDRAAGTEVLPALAGLTSRGAALALSLQRAKPAWLLLLRGEDSAEVDATVRAALARAANAAGHAGALDQPAARAHGADLWRVGDRLVLARRDALTLLSGDEELLRQSLALAAEAEATGLAGEESFRSSSAARTSDEVLWGWIDLESARELQRRVGRDRGLLELAAALARPQVQMLLGPGLAALGSARCWTLAAHLDGEDLALRLAADGIDAGPAAALLPTRDGPVPVPPPGGGLNALEAVLYRDLAGVFRVRTELFSVEVLPRFAEAEANLALFFGGADVAEEVLPHLSPWIGAVARPVAFDPRAVPELPLPALALLVEVDDPQAVGEDLVAAFQTLIGLSNVDRAQKGADPLRLELEQVEGVTLTCARFRAPLPGDGVDLRYNLEPACALVGRTFVVGTHAALVADLIGELRAGARTSSPARGERLALSGAALAELVETNRELLVTNAVLKEGKSRDRAEGDVRVLRDAAALIDVLELSVHYPRADRVALELRLELHGEETPR